MTTVAVEKEEVLHISSSVILVTQHAQRICHNILSPVTCLALSYFSKLSKKSHDFRGKKLLNKKRVYFLYNICLKHVTVKIIQRDIITIHKTSRKVPAILVRF